MSRSGIFIRLAALAMIAPACAAPAKHARSASQPHDAAALAQIQPVNDGYAIVTGAPGAAAGKHVVEALAIGSSVRMDRLLLETAERLSRSDGR